MTDQQASTAGSEDEKSGQDEDDNENDDSATEIDEAVDDGVTVSDKEPLDLSSDESQKTQLSGHAGSQKNEKKSVQRFKPKVKIKTLTIDGQLVYFCKICDKIFTRRKDKLNHELAHSGESVLTCTECGKEYLHESSLASHMRTHDGDPLFMCDLCPKMFAQSHHLKTHILSHSEPTNFVCKTCYTEFPTAADLNHHNRTKIKLEMTKYWCKMCKVYLCRNHELNCDNRLHAFCCSACNELFYTHKKLKIHMKKFAHFSTEKPKAIEPLQEHELYPFKASEAVKKAQAQKENELLKQSQKSNIQPDKRPSEDNVENEMPSKKFKLSPRKATLDGDQSSTSLQESATEVKKEMETDMKSPCKHRKGKPYCKKCNKSYKDSSELDRHKALVHEEKPDVFQCDNCDMVFTSKDDLERHSFKHTGERMHTCPMCGEEFPRSMQLTKHLRTHVGDFPYKCSQCGKAFRLKIQLIQHVRLHMAQDANACENCPAKFSTRTELQDHILQCHGETGSFKCHLCSKTFSFRYKLLNHLRLHTNVKCFQCYICHKTFATKHYLQRHLQVHLKQGMDVDVQNIVVDEDSKLELEAVRKQMTHQNIHGCENGSKLVSADRLEIQGVRKNDLKRSMFSLDVEKNVKIERNTDLEISGSKNENKIVNLWKIKVEAPDETDIGSEDSFCSSLTRDSERSDPFKFSSDDSNSFKAAMWKERRRLKRRWRKNQRQPSCLQYDFSSVTKCEEMNGEVCDEVKNGEEEDDFMDMKVELNGVMSEMDDVMSIYVNLTHMKSLKPSGIPPCVEQSNLLLRDEKKSSLNLTDSLKASLQQDIKDEIEDKFDNLHEEARLKDHVNKEESDKGKSFVFDIDMEAFEEGQFKLVAQTECEEEKESLNETKKITKFNFPKDQDEVHFSESHQKKLKLNQTLTSESSDLERLKAAFESSSKYLPSSQTCYTQSDSSYNQPQYDNRQKSIESYVNTGDKSVTVKKESHGENSQDCYITNEFPTSSQALSGQKISVLPPLNKQDKNTDQGKHQKSEVLYAKSDTKIIQPKSSLSHSSIYESSSTTQTQASSEKDNKSTSLLGKQNSNFNTGRENNLESSHRVSTFPPSHSNISQFTSQSNTRVLKPTASSAPVQSQTISGPSYLPHTQEPVVIDSARMYRNPSLENHQQYCQPSSQSLNNPSSLPSLISSRNSVGDSILHSGSKSAFSALVNSSHTSDSSISASLSCSSVNPNHLSVNPNHQAITNPPNFSLNPSSIFDTNNPTLRDMNMMDLVGSNHPPAVQPLLQPSLNLEPQNSVEAQMRQALVTSLGGAHNISVRQEPPLVNLGNPSLSLNVGNVIHPLNQGLAAPSIAVNTGHVDGSLLNMRQVSRGDLMVQMRNVYESQDSLLIGGSGIIPQIPSNVGSIPINPVNSLPVNFGGLGSLHPGGVGPSNSLTVGNFAGIPQNPSGFTSFDPISLHNCGLPTGMGVNSHLINGLNPSHAPFQGLRLQDNLRASIQAPGVNVWNPSMILPGNPQLPGATLNMISGFNPGYFPNF